MRPTDFFPALERKTPAPKPEADKWIDGTPKAQLRVRDHNGNEFDRARFIADPEYRMQNGNAYRRTRVLEEEQRRTAANAEATARAREDMKARFDARVRRVAEEQIRQESAAERLEDLEQRVRERTEQLKPQFEPKID